MTEIRIRAGSEQGPDLTVAGAVDVLTAGQEPGGIVAVTVVDHLGVRVFGQSAEVVVSTDLGSRVATAKVRMPGVGAHEAEVGLLRTQCYLTAITIATAVSAVMMARGRT